MPWPSRPCATPTIRTTWPETGSACPSHPQQPLTGHRSLTTTTFGYSAAQDRIWMRVHEQDAMVWLTRRMVANIVGPVLKAFEAATPGEQGGATAATRAAIEHDLSLNEVAPGQRPAQIRSGRVLPGEQSGAQERLCTRITTRSNSQSVVMTFDTETGPMVLRMSRKGTHLWFQGLVMVLRQARWDLPERLPEWLGAGVLPASLQELVNRPLPDDLDES